jgi:hypothetical protein
MPGCAELCAMRARSPVLLLVALLLQSPVQRVRQLVAVGSVAARGLPAPLTHFGYPAQEQRRTAEEARV